MSEWSKIVIHEMDEEKKEIISAWLMHFGAESIVDQGEYLEAYSATENVNEIVSNFLETKMSDPATVSFEKVENQNWNEAWESSFEPINVGDIHIRAEFHPKSDKTEIVIQPKMAFGTGHHETTYMMIDHMNKMNFDNKTVLDYGCGTGILAVFAAMKNAKAMDAIDIQTEAVENTVEHFEINNLKDFPVLIKEGDLDVLGSASYDIILANINRHVLIENVSNLKARLNKEGILLMSGIMESDRALIVETYTTKGFNLKQEAQRGQWCLFVFS